MKKTIEDYWVRDKVEKENFNYTIHILKEIEIVKDDLKINIDGKILINVVELSIGINWNIIYMDSVMIRKVDVPILDVVIV